VVCPEQAAIAGSTINAVMLTGGALGLAVLASLARDRTEALTHLNAEQAVAERHAFSFAAAAIACAVAAAAAAAGLRWRPRSGGSPSSAAREDAHACTLTAPQQTTAKPLQITEPENKTRR
jgi:hypothetical protein